jgi:ketosteroid isomerase-like protein
VGKKSGKERPAVTGWSLVRIRPGEPNLTFGQIAPSRATLGQYEVMPLSDAAVVVTGLDTVTGVRDGTPFSNNGRVTFVVAKRGPDWKIVHFHRSAMPQ